MEDNAWPRRANLVDEFLESENNYRMDRWVGRVMNLGMALTQWSPRSPDLTICVFLVRNGRNKVFIPTLPVGLAELNQRITAAIGGFDSDTLRLFSVNVKE
ncbi:hypothetical protein TNCV_5006591 [Trichonephila clavipes]|uniref:Uncharacterized protein n=1 Tax=Trichonephila clavipes TaxID=2585209 RepID=A0A8X6SAM9_TRICX|nr:hypothetical protein TNCV_5006591 [Trichonephila clavipes]